MDIHADFMPLYREGLSDAEIARRLFWSTGVVRHWRNDNGLPANKPRPPQKNHADAEAMWSLYKSGLPDKEIAEQLGVSSNYVRDWRFRQGLRANRIRDKQFNRYQELYDEYKNDSEIAALCGVTSSAVRHWRKKRNLPIV